MTKQLNLGRDLQDEGRIGNIQRSTPRRNYTSVGRAALVDTVLPASATVKQYRSGGYQGYVGIVVWYDGYTWVIKDVYGSYGHCDGLIDASVEEQQSYAEQLLRNAYCFPSDGAAALYVAENEGYGWSQLPTRERVGLVDLFLRWPVPIELSVSRHVTPDSMGWLTAARACQHLWPNRHCHIVVDIWIKTSILQRLAASSHDFSHGFPPFILYEIRSGVLDILQD